MTFAGIGARLAGVRAVAGNTFREAARDRVLYLVVAFGLLVLVSGKVIGWVSVNQDVKIIRDIGLASVSFFGAMIALFVGTGLIQREMGGRTIYTILARPVARWQFVVGKYAGLFGTVLAATAGMSLVFLVYLAIMTHLAPGETLDGAAPPAALGWPIVQALVLTGFELMLVTSLAVLFSSVSTPILSAVFTFFTYVAGQFASDVAWLAEMAARGAEGEPGSPFWGAVLGAVYRLMPNLDLLNVRGTAVHAIAVPAGQMAWTIVYAIAYSALVLVIACALFERRDLP